MASSSPTARAAALVIPCFLFACGGDDHKAPAQPEADADVTASHGDATVGSTPPRHDAGDPEQPPIHDLDGGLVPMDGSTPPSDTPDASPTSDAQTPPVTVSADPDRPWQIDCANLPSNGVCQGGPHEVLLATTDMGDVLMFDPQDGHYIGPLKGPSQNPGYVENGYQLATQGPDLCIWTVSGDDNDDTVRAVERWNTDGSFRDDIIPRGKYDRNGNDRLEEARALAFGPDFVLVSAGDINLDAAQVSKYGLDGTFQKELFVGRFESLSVLGDGSLLTSGEKIQRWPDLDGTPSNVYTEPTLQIAYAGAGTIYSPDFSDYTLHRVRLDNGNATDFTLVQSGDEEIHGVAVLDGGKLLFADTWDVASAVYVFDPSMPTAARPPSVFATNGSSRGSIPVVTNFGRACLPEAVVARKNMANPEVTADHCDDVPAGTAILSEDFETGAFAGVGTNHSFNGWTDSDPSLNTPPAEITTDEHVSGQRALKVYASPDKFTFKGVERDFGSVKPSYIGYYQKFDTSFDGYGELAIKSDSTLEEIGVGKTGVHTTHSNVSEAVENDSWVRIQLRNIDWDKMQYDLYVNCKRVGIGVWLEPDVGKTLKKVSLFAVPDNVPGDTSDGTAAAYYDDIVVK